MKKLKNWGAVLLLGLLGTSHSVFADISYNYFYDELNRLTKATDSTGVVLEYVYDEVGNILAVNRIEASGLSIINVSLETDTTGSHAIIDGVGFSTVPSENIVTVDGIAANVISATSTHLEIDVPADVTAGLVAVTVGGNVATASGNLQIQAVPVISSLSTKHVLSGTSIPSLTVTGDNLTGSTFVFTPTFVPTAVVVASATVAPDGKSAVLQVDVAPAAVGSFVLQASSTVGQSSVFSSDANTLTVLGSATDDSDGDGLTNAEEIAQGTDPTSGDSDKDGLPDKYEIDNGLDPTNAADAQLDSDNDGINNLTEFEQGTDPQNSDVTPPGIAQVLPADNDVDFATNANVVVRFTEPLQPGSILPSSVRLFQGGLLVAGRTILSSDQLSVTFEPLESLGAFATYTLEVQAVRDVAGNSMAGVFQSSFATGELADEVRPTIVRASIPNGAENVPINVPFTLLFDEPMDPATLDDSTFTVLDSETSQSIAGMIQVDADGATVSFVPEQPFPVGRRLTVFLNSGIADVSGNLLATFFFSTFTTAFEEDTVPLTIVSVSPPNGMVDVPTNSNIMMEFSEPLNLINIVGAITLQANGTDIPGSVALSNGNRSATFTPAADLPPNAVITLNAAAEISDLVGNALGAVVDSAFTTGPGIDLQRPRISTLTPFNGEVNVTTNALLQVEVDERVNPLTVTESNFTLFNRTTSQFVSGTRSVSADGKTLTFVPDTPLETDRSYQLFASSNIKDLANNALIGSVARFTTGAGGVSTGALSVGNISVQDGTTEVPVNTAIVVQLSDAINAVNMPADAIVLAAGGVPIAGTNSLSSDRRQLTFTPTSNLTVSTLYTVDVSGLVSIGGSTLTPFNSSFTTSASAIADTTRPTLVSVDPANNAIGVLSNAVATIQFSERVNPLTITENTFFIQQTTNGTAQIAGAISLASDGLSATFTPDQPLLAGNEYQVKVLNSIQDLTGNTYSGLTTPSTFTVDSVGGVIDSARPTVVMVTPTDGSTDVHQDTRVVLTFSESLDPNTINTNNFLLFENNNPLTFISITRSSDNRSVTLSHSLPLGSEVAVVVTNGVRDLAGNALAGFSSTFSTEASFDTLQPQVIMQQPVNGAPNIPVTQSIVLFVNEELQATTIPGALHVSQNGVLVEGAVTVTPDGRGIEFVPDTPLENNALIQVFLDDTAQDLSGNVVSSYQGSFRTAVDTSLIGPSLIRTNLSAVVGILPANPVIELEFSEPLDAATINSTTVVLHENISGAPIVASTLSLVDGQIIQITPDTSLTADSSYFIDIFNGIQDLDGQIQLPSRSLETFVSRQPFTTGNVDDNAGPIVIAVSPPDGTTEVALNTNIRVRFDERINPLTITTDTIRVTDGVTIIIPHTISFTDNDRDILIAAFSPLKANTVYNIIIDGVEDNAGNLVATQTTQFTTGAGIDTARPVLVITTPVNGATDVPVNSPIVLEINEPIDPVSVNSSTFTVRDNATFQNVSGTASASADGRVISFVPDVPFAVGHSYTVIVSGLMVDLAGNPLDGFFNFFGFTTAFAEDTVPPQVQAVSPEDGLGAVATNARVMISFDEPVQGHSDDQVMLSVGGTEIAVTRIWSNGNRLLELIPSLPLAANTVHTVTVNAALLDTAGNALGTAFTSQFTTGPTVDIQSPTVLASTPFNGETNVPTNTLLQVEVSERVNPLTVTESSFTLFNRTTFQFVSGTRSVSADGKILTFVPDVPLETVRSYTLTANSNIKDLANNPLNGNSSNFFTEP